MTLSINSKENIPDIQSSLDKRLVPISKVGVKDIRFPAKVKVEDKLISSVINISMYVDLPADQKGTHMSRFLEILEEEGQEIDLNFLGDFLDIITERLGAETSFVEMDFPIFLEKPAPVTGVTGLLDYEITVRGRGGKNKDIEMGVKVPVTTLCPCSKKISRYGAHNQRSVVGISTRSESAMSPVELIKIAEKHASCDLYPILKRADEKYVTERAYENPRFVEDLVRDIAIDLDKLNGVNWFKVSSENFESIHNHSAYAEIIKDKRDQDVETRH